MQRKRWGPNVIRFERLSRPVLTICLESHGLVLSLAPPILAHVGVRQMGDGPRLPNSAHADIQPVALPSGPAEPSFQAQRDASGASMSLDGMLPGVSVTPPGTPPSSQPSQLSQLPRARISFSDVRRPESDSPAMGRQASRVLMRNQPMPSQHRIDEVHRMVQDDIIGRERTPPVDPEGTLPGSLPHSKSSIHQEAENAWGRLGRFLNACFSLTLFLGGMIPWSVRHFWLSLSYQVLVLVVHAVIVCGSLARASEALQGLTTWHDVRVPFLLSDLVVALGSFVGLMAMGAFRGSPQVLKWGLAIREYSKKHDFGHNMQVATGIDCMATSVVWLCFMSGRLCSAFALLQNHQLPLREARRHPL